MRRPDGFSLLEVMIAVAFLGLALVAVIRVEGQGLSLSGEARFNARAVFLADYLLAEAQTQGDLSPGIKEAAFEGLGDRIEWMREVTPAPGFPGLYRVQVWVYRTGRPAREGVTLLGFAYRSGS
ncbi:MAG: prepilin-type N-terminal cleavage/methylation domain-containing protein [Thermodesulfobacteriota bacterium]